MVIGVSQLKRRHRAIPRAVENEVRQQLPREAEKVVREIQGLVTIPEITIHWKWGAPPSGAVRLGTVRRSARDAIVISIYAKSPQGSGFDPAWFEFGTKDRFHQSGKFVGRIRANPFFWPVIRANKSRVKGNISRAVTRGFKRAK